MMSCSLSIGRKTGRIRIIKCLVAAMNTLKPWGCRLIGEVKKIDDHTVQFVLTRQEAPLLTDLVMDFSSIFSKEYADNIAESQYARKSGSEPG